MVSQLIPIKSLRRKKPKRKRRTWVGLAHAASSLDQCKASKKQWNVVKLHTSCLFLMQKRGLQKGNSSQKTFP